MRRAHRNAGAARLAQEYRQLVRVRQIERHRCGEKLGRVIGFQVSGLISNKCVAGRVTLVEAVAREFLDKFEDRRRLPGINALFLGALDETRALAVHLLLLLLAHRTAQQIRLAERVTGKDLRDLHHLFLVDDDAVSLLQRSLERRMEIVRRRQALLALDIGRDVLHRTGAIEGHERNDVLEAVRLHRAQCLAHAGRFKLEHADGRALAEHCKGLFVIERQIVRVDVAAGVADETRSPVDDRQRLEAEEIEFDEACRLHPLHIVLGGGKVRARIAVERRQLVERAVADDDPCRVCRCMAVKPLKLQRLFEQRRDAFIARALLAQSRLALDRLGKRHWIGGIVGNELAEPVNLRKRHADDAADIAKHRARLQFSKGDDLRDAIGAVFLLDVTDDFVAPVLAEVDVEVGHRHALGIEETLEQQAEPQRIEVGDRQRPGDQRTGARTPAGTDGNPFLFRPFDEVGDDQEVTRKPHLADDVDLEFETIPIVGFRRCKLHPQQAFLQAFARLLLEFARFGGDRSRRGAGRRRFLGEPREDRLAGARTEGAAARDFNGRLNRLGKVGEKRAHLRR